MSGTAPFLDPKPIMTREEEAENYGSAPFLLLFLFFPPVQIILIARILSPLIALQKKGVRRSSKARGGPPPPPRPRFPLFSFTIPHTRGTYTYRTTIAQCTRYRSHPHPYFIRALRSHGFFPAVRIKTRRRRKIKG